MGRFRFQSIGFREAVDRPAAVNLGKTAVQTVGFWGFFLYAAPMWILWAEDWSGLDWFRFGEPGLGCWWLGAVLLAPFSALGLWSGVTMALDGRGTPLPTQCPRRLVVSGPYRFVRNPMAVAGIAQGVCVGLVAGSGSIIAYALGGAVMWELFVRRAEERDLAARFGGEYAAYQRAVRCWVPRVRPYARATAQSTDNPVTLTG